MIEGGSAGQVNERLQSAMSLDVAKSKMGGSQELERQNKHISLLLLTPHFPRLLSKK